jgi:hypothetical protein
VTALTLKPKVKMSNSFYGWLDFILVPHLKVLDKCSEIFVSGIYTLQICQADIKQLNNCYATRTQQPTMLYRTTVNFILKVT